MNCYCCIIKFYVIFFLLSHAPKITMKSLSVSSCCWFSSLHHIFLHLALLKFLIHCLKSTMKTCVVLLFFHLPSRVCLYWICCSVCVHYYLLLVDTWPFSIRIVFSVLFTPMSYVTCVNVLFSAFLFPLAKCYMSFLSGGKERLVMASKNAKLEYSAKWEKMTRV